jgi:DNA mismatch repair protein MutS
MTRYDELKAKLPRMMIFIRNGNFYETFGQDARVASEVLGLALTTHDGRLMVSFPCRQAATYKRKLAAAGHWVALTR